MKEKNVSQRKKDYHFDNLIENYLSLKMIFRRNQRKILENLAILSRVQEDTASIKEKTSENATK